MLALINNDELFIWQNHQIADLNAAWSHPRSYLIHSFENSIKGNVNTVCCPWLQSSTAGTKTAFTLVVTEIRIWSLKQLYLFLFSFSSNTSCFMIWWQPTVLSVYLYAAPTMVCHLSILCLLICVFVYVSLFLYLYFYVFNVVCTLCRCHAFISLDTAVLTAIVDDVGYHKIMCPLILCTFLYVYNHMLLYVVVSAWCRA